MSTRTAASSKKEKCEEMYAMYHAKFPDVETLTSKQYLTAPGKFSTKPILVDVRSESERAVSVIPGSIALAEFESGMNHDKTDDATVVVVTYCTIGYRSGLEARRLRDTYGCRVMNLDGIVNYTHACAEIEAAAKEQNDGIAPPTTLVKPGTNEPTRKVHVFGPAWDVCNDQFESTYFPPPEMVLRGAGVGATALLRRMRECAFATCCPCRNKKKSISKDP